MSPSEIINFVFSSENYSFAEMRLLFEFWKMIHTCVPKGNSGTVTMNSVCFINSCLTSTASFVSQNSLMIAIFWGQKTIVQQPVSRKQPGELRKQLKGEKRKRGNVPFMSQIQFQVLFLA